MKVPGLVTIESRETELLDEMACIVGTSFLEELWFVTWLEALDSIGTSKARKKAITQRAIQADYHATAPYGCCFTLEDKAGAINAYLRSEISDAEANKLDEEAMSFIEEYLTDEEKLALGTRAQAMEAISDTSWPRRIARPDDDFIYIASLGIDASKRGSGAFGRLFKPLLAYADQLGIDCYLDCYTDRLEQIYTHYGFKVVDRKGDPSIELAECCMVRRPQQD